MITNKSRLIKARTDPKKQSVNHDDETMSLIMNSALDAIICINESGKITLWNPQAEKIFGWKEQQALGKRLSETTIPQQYRKRHEEGLKHYLQTGEGLVLNKLIEITALNRKGKEFPVELTVIPIKQNGTEFFCAFLRDITERKKAEDELRISELRYRSLIEHASDPIMITDQTGNFIDVISTLCNMFGYNNKELLKLNVRALIYTVQLKTEPMNFDRLVKGEHVFSQRRMMHKNGTIILVEANVKMIPDGRMLAIARDITERKKAEDALRLSEQKYKLLFNKNPLPMLMFSKPDMRFIDVNDAAVSQYGYSREEFLSMTAKEIRPIEDIGLYKKKLKESVDGINYFGVLRHKKKNGTVFKADIIGHNIIYDNKPVWLILVNDITEKILTEENLKLSHEKLRQLSSHLENVREEERTNISREIHDELGQQLTGLKMEASWLNKKIAPDDKIAHTKIKGMISLIDETVKTVRRISSELRPRMLDELGLTDALDWQSKEFEKRIGFRCMFNSKVGEMKINRNLSTGIFRVYQETLTNVVRHAQATEIKASLEHSNGNLILKVHDNGKGFNEAEIKNKNTLGLVGMRERATIFGGTLKIESIKGKGTTIFLQVPLKATQKKANLNK